MTSDIFRVIAVDFYLALPYIVVITLLLAALNLLRLRMVSMRRERAMKRRSLTRTIPAWNTHDKL